MSKKILYYSRPLKDSGKNLGIVNKVKGQIEGFEKNGFSVDAVWLKSNGIYFNEEKIHDVDEGIFNSMYKIAYYYLFMHHRILRRKIDFTFYDVIYFRYEMSHPGLLKTFQYIKLINPTATLILEVATYPYVNEMKGRFRRIQYALDEKYRKLLKKYIDVIVNYNGFDNIFGIPAVSIQNGISTSRAKIKTQGSFTKDKINLLAVGSVNYWHGLDRVVEGLFNYYKNNVSINVFFTIVGSGEAIIKLKKQVDKRKLNDVISFIEPLDGLELDNIFDMAHIGIGDLGSFRKNMDIAYSLRHREYTSRGLPFVLSTPDPDFPETLSWIKYFPNDDTPILIEDVIRFYQKLDKKKYPNEMRNTAEQKLSWHTILKKLSDKLFP